MAVHAVKANLCARYDEVWQQNKLKVAAGNIVPESNPVEGDPRFGLSLVFRPSASDFLDKKLPLLQNDLMRYLPSDRHLFYSAETFHTTIRSLEGFRQHVKTDDDDIQTYSSILDRLMNAHLPIRITYRGLFASDTGVFIQGWVDDHALKDLRDDLDNALVNVRPEYTSPDSYRQRTTCHMTAVVYKSEDIADSVALAEYIDLHRDTYYGEQVYSNVDLVQYIFIDKVLILNKIKSF